MCGGVVWAHQLLSELQSNNHRAMSLLPEVLYLVDRGNTTNNSVLESVQKTVSSENDTGYLSKLTPRNSSSYFRRQRASFQLPNIDLNNSLNVQGERRLNRPKTATLDYPKVLHTPPLQARRVTSRSTLSETCHFCGEKFGSASIMIHQKQCQKKLLLKHNKPDITANKNQKISNQTSQLLPLQGAYNSDTRETKASSWKPSRSECQYCGVKFGTHSIAMHEKRCTHKSNALSNDPNNMLHQNNGKISSETSRATSSTCNSARIVARVVTVGLVPGKIEYLYFYANTTPNPPRPKTRALEQSTLRSSGIKLPSTASCSFTVKHNPTTLCENCGESVSPDRTAVHTRICKKSNSAPPGINVTLPSLHNLLRIDQEVQSEQSEKGTVSRKPRTVVCYICGREYGTKSIAIHEPQCMKKWQAENRKLPIRKRKPLPKKKEELTKLTCVVQDHDSERLIRPLTGDSGDIGDSIMQGYFQHCYSEFEKELIPCKKCGRTFAPERHFIHEPNCNAKPLSNSRLKR